MRTGTRRVVAGNGCGALSGKTWICTSGRGRSAVADRAVAMADAVDSAGADTAEASDATGAGWSPLITAVELSLTTSLSFLTRRQSGPPPRSLKRFVPFGSMHSQTSANATGTVKPRLRTRHMSEEVIFCRTIIRYTAISVPSSIYGPVHSHPERN